MMFVLYSELSKVQYSQLKYNNILSRLYHYYIYNNKLIRYTSVIKVYYIILLTEQKHYMIKYKKQHHTNEGVSNIKDDIRSL